MWKRQQIYCSVVSVCHLKHLKNWAFQKKCFSWFEHTLLNLGFVYKTRWRCKRVLSSLTRNWSSRWLLPRVAASCAEATKFKGNTQCRSLTKLKDPAQFRSHTVYRSQRLFQKQHNSEIPHNLEATHFRDPSDMFRSNTIQRSHTI